MAHILVIAVKKVKPKSKLDFSCQAECIKLIHQYRENLQIFEVTQIFVARTGVAGLKTA